MLSIVFSCFLNVLTLRDNLISSGKGKEFQKTGPDIFTPLDMQNLVCFSSNYNWSYYLCLVVNLSSFTKVVLKYCW